MFRAYACAYLATAVTTCLTWCFGVVRACHGMPRAEPWHEQSSVALDLSPRDVMKETRRGAEHTLACDAGQCFCSDEGR